jgi:myo-inositol-hexaphosphate 3-phosphohydrolase
LISAFTECIPRSTRIEELGSGSRLLCLSGSKGYLIASSQGISTFQVCDRDGSNAFVLAVDPTNGTIVDVGETHGIEVTNIRT